MERLLLGNSALEVSKLSLGTWAFSGAKIWGGNSEDDSIRTIHTALDSGINLIDTAERYGNGLAEEVLGKALKGRRQEAVVATKVYADELRYDQVISACEGSLKRMDTDYIDLYQIHWPNHDIPFDETFSAFDKLIKDGKIRAVSVCNFGCNDITGAAKYGVVLDQLPYSLIWRVIENEIIPACSNVAVPVWAYVPLGQGLLSGKFKSIDDVPLNRRETRLYSCKWQQGRHTDPGFEEEVFSYLSELTELCNASGCSMSAVALAFLKRNKSVASILMGARNQTQLEQNLAAYHKNIPDDVLDRAIALSEPLKRAQGNNADLWVSENRMR